MTDDDKALVEAMKDAVLHGRGFIKDGKHIPIEDVYIDPRDATIEAQAAEIERLRESLEIWIFHHQRAMGQKPDDARAYAKAWMFRNANGEEPE